MFIKKSQRSIGWHLTAVLVLTVAAVGSLRTGGLAELRQWMQATVGAWPPPLAVVPTPLPVAVDVPPVQLDLLSAQLRTRGGQAAGARFSSHNRTRVRLPTVTPNPITPEEQDPAALHQPSLLPTSTLEPTPSVPPYQPAAPFVELTGLHHWWQTWNNCGPTTLAMYLSYFGSRLAPDDIRPLLRTHPDDPNVTPVELATVVRSQGYEAQVLSNGNSERLRLLLSNGFPVLVENWMEEEPNNGMGHYRLLTGYDDARRYWIAYDSYFYHHPRNPNGSYQGINLGYDEFDAWWKVFNRTYLLVYRKEQASLVQSLLGDELDPQQMWKRALEVAWGAVAQQPADAFAWFNVGTDLVAVGRYEEAAAAYDRAQQLGLPWRMLWYQFGPFQAYYASGRYPEVVTLANATLATTNGVEELYYWRGQGVAALDDYASARQAWQHALALNPHYTQAREALAALDE